MACDSLRSGLRGGMVCLRVLWSRNECFRSAARREFPHADRIQVGEGKAWLSCYHSCWYRRGRCSRRPSFPRTGENPKSKENRARLHEGENSKLEPSDQWI